MRRGTEASTAMSSSMSASGGSRGGRATSRAAGSGCSFPIGESRFLFIASPFNVHRSPVSGDGRRVRGNVSVETGRSSILTARGNNGIMTIGRGTGANNNGSIAIRCTESSKDGIRAACVRLSDVIIGINSRMGTKRGLNMSNGAKAQAANRRLRFKIGAVSTSNGAESISPTSCLTRVTRGNGLGRRTLCGNGSLLTGCGKGDSTISADLSPSS